MPGRFGFTNARRWKEASDQWVREKADAEGVVVLEGTAGLFVYVARTGARPLLVMRANGGSQATLHSLLPLIEVARVAAVDHALVPPLPAHASNLVVAARLATSR